MTSTTPANEKNNWMGIVAIIAAFLFPILGIVFGHLGLAAVKKGEANNRGLALAGTVIGYIMVALGIIIFIVVNVFVGVAANTIENEFEDISEQIQDELQELEDLQEDFVNENS